MIYLPRSFYNFEILKIAHYLFIKIISRSVFLRFNRLTDYGILSTKFWLIKLKWIHTVIKRPL